MRATTISMTASCVILGACLAACVPGDQREQSASVATSTVTVTASESSAAGTTTAEATTDVGGSTSCSTDGRAAISAAMTQIAPPLPPSMTESHWVYGGSTNYNTCNELSYATLDTAGATASSPMQLLLFHHGRFVGTGIKCNAAYQTVNGASETSVDVTYRYLNDGDISANPTGSVDVAFLWDGSEVVMNGDLPYGVTQGRC